LALPVPQAVEVYRGHLVLGAALAQLAIPVPKEPWVDLDQKATKVSRAHLGHPGQLVHRVIQGQPVDRAQLVHLAFKVNRDQSVQLGRRATKETRVTKVTRVILVHRVPLVQEANRGHRD
jgi:hypothetical protein